MERPEPTDRHNSPHGCRDSRTTLRPQQCCSHLLSVMQWKQTGHVGRECVSGLQRRYALGGSPRGLTLNHVAGKDLLDL